MLTLILLAAISQSELTGTVVRISDGDTIRILTDDGREQKIRLAGIDAPESDQPYGSESRKVLAALVAGKTVVVKHKGQYHQKRLVGQVYMDGRNIQMEMVEMGAAWHARRYSKSIEQEGMQCEARTESRGLWALPNPISPDEWRRGRRK
eukprot:gnl/Spiro4/664_TR377_c0_g1_i1.p1 gnl/Spiro4/664_TR377_c0_g1~~gnl/Spiro4/664_TR377_c0_g1_i1.p1  ORF type:complete len:150 (-),score=10.59 gnl/Spiro4/664_TR377_c0_g1_i1:439-888(-)